MGLVSRVADLERQQQHCPRHATEQDRGAAPREHVDRDVVAAVVGLLEPAVDAEPAGAELGAGVVDDLDAGTACAGRRTRPARARPCASTTTSPERSSTARGVSADRSNEAVAAPARAGTGTRRCATAPVHWPPSSWSGSTPPRAVDEVHAAPDVGVVDARAAEQDTPRSRWSPRPRRVGGAPQLDVPVAARRTGSSEHAAPTPGSVSKPSTSGRSHPGSTVASLFTNAT